MKHLPWNMHSKKMNLFESALYLQVYDFGPQLGQRIILSSGKGSIATSGFGRKSLGHRSMTRTLIPLT